MIPDPQEEKAAPELRNWFRRMGWQMPIMVVILGLISFVLLIWMNKINQGQRRDFDHCDALMDIQINSTAFHLWLEEAITGDATVDIQKVWESIDLASSLVEAILAGGKSEHGVIMQPLKDSALRKGMEDLKPLLAQIKKIGLQRMRKPETSGIGSAMDELFDEVFKEIQIKARALEILLERDFIRHQDSVSRLFWGILLAWTFVVVVAITGLWHREARRRLAEEALADAKNQLEIKVAERTKDLRRVNDQLRHLSSQLLTAQEKERKRIAAELHDELGASLALLRIEFTLIEKNLNADQRELRERCRRNLEYIGLVAGNVSRISRNLSPYLLEDLGFSAALRSLLSDFGKRLNIQVTSEIPELENLFPQDVETTSYRIIQESLTNISKHAQAQHVSLVIKIADDEVCFTVEDDGKGFNVEQEKRKDALKRGMGLPTMEERVRILGGSFELWSQEGQGSRTTFCIPKNEGGPP
ncbi:MAG: sensor histidine kinase [Deltaproteobacteria bacterium]|nr:sensor histidine kinase [Deltaproteobacteria bacterium]